MSECSRCLKNKKLKKHKNEYFCSKCYNLYCRPQKKCVECQKIRAVEKYIEFGPVCSSCYIKHKKKEKCYVCNEKGIVSKKDSCGFVCKRCYNKQFRPQEKCIICKRKKVVNFRTEVGPICKPCYKTPEQICSICGLKNSIKKGIKDLVICNKCYFKYRYDNDERFCVLHKLRSRTQLALKNYLSKGKVKSCEEYGVDFEAIIKRLGECPGKRENYHIDHIFPLAAFNLSNPLHVRAAFAPENHQWLLAEENFSKNATYDCEKLEKYLNDFDKEKKG